MPPVFVSLGLFLLDEHVWLDEKAKMESQRPSEPQLGGGGMFGAIGARIWLDEPMQAVNLVHRGYDWREEDTVALERYSVARFSNTQKDQATGRARFTYKSESEWRWEMLTPVIRHTPRSLVGTDLYGCTWLHNLNWPHRYLPQLAELDEFEDWQPKLAYEPHPDAASPESLDLIKQILPRVDVFSPNAKEAGLMLSIQADSLPGQEAAIEQCCFEFARLGAKDIVVIRAGPLGACLLRKGWSACRWMPAFFQDQSAVIDDTGAGNAFLGGLVAGLHFSNDDLWEAAYYATVSASYTIEQFGLPVLRDDGLWNNSSRPRDRLEELKQRVNRSMRGP